MYHLLDKYHTMGISTNFIYEKTSDKGIANITVTNHAVYKDFKYAIYNSKYIDIDVGAPLIEKNIRLTIHYNKYYSIDNQSITIESFIDYDLLLQVFKI